MSERQEDGTVPGGASESDADRPARLDVGVVGTGRVGAVLGAALGRAGHRVVAAYGVSVASRQRAACAAARCSRSVTPAEVFAAVGPGASRGARRRAARVSSRAWSPPVRYERARSSSTPVAATERPFSSRRRALGALPLALHPAMTFTGTALDLERLAGAVFGVTAPEPLWPVAEALVVEMGAEPIRVAEEHRTLYHAALAHGANHLVTLIADAMDLLRAAGVDGTRSHARTAAVGHAGQRPAARRRSADRSGRARRRGHRRRGTSKRSTRVAPEAVAAYVALARRTATRALAVRTVCAPRTPSPCSTCSPNVPTRPATDASHRRHRARPPRAGLGGSLARSSGTCSGLERKALTIPTHDGPVLASTRAALADAQAAADAETAVVMTMGASARRSHSADPSSAGACRPDGVVIVTIFVNPLQFGAGEDLDRYPRTLEADLDVCAHGGRRVVFAPRPRRDVPRR